MSDEPGRAPATSLAVRDRLVEALQLDLVGPWPSHRKADLDARQVLCQQIAEQIWNPARIAEELTA